MHGFDSEKDGGVGVIVRAMTYLRASRRMLEEIEDVDGELDRDPIIEDLDKVIHALKHRKWRAYPRLESIASTLRMGEQHVYILIGYNLGGDSTILSVQPTPEAANEVKAELEADDYYSGFEMDVEDWVIGEILTKSE